MIYFTIQEMIFSEKDLIISNLIKHTENICNKLLKYKFTNQEYSIIEHFINLMNKKISITKYYEIIDLFIQKYSKIKPEALNKITESTIKEKFMDSICELKINELSPDKFIKWVFQTGA